MLTSFAAPVDERPGDRPDAAPSAASEQWDAVVVGAGFAGMYMLYRLRDAGFRVTAFEAAPEVGGTWFWNRYPGARVDTPSLQYSFSFSPELEQEWCWPETYSSQRDLERYANHVADRFDLRRHIHFSSCIVDARWRDSEQRWRVTSDRGEVVEATYLITATGCLSAANVPDFPGLESFAGGLHHTSRWPHEDPEFEGKRVGVVGTGSTGIQVVPVVAERAQHVYVFQRTPNFSLPSSNMPMDPFFERHWKSQYRTHRESARDTVFGLELPFPSERSALDMTVEECNAVFEAAWREGAVAVLQAFSDLMTDDAANDRVAEFVRAKIRATVDDPAVAELLLPMDHPLGSKRISINDGYYEAFNRENVTLVDIREDPIEQIIPSGVRTGSSEYPVDALVLATGFDAITGPLIGIGLVGRHGQQLAEKWASGPSTYLGLATSDFPNLFMITGPGSPSVLSNMMTSIEQHVDWIHDLLVFARASGAASIEVSADAEQAWGRHVADVAAGTLYQRADSWFNGANIPGKPRGFIPYAGGVGRYRRICADIADRRYPGFTLAPSPVVTK